MTDTLSSSRISAVIVNYNSGAYAMECIKSLLQQNIGDLEIIIVDNASQDGSVSLFRSTFGEQVIVIESQENLGFGRANNLAASVANGDWLLLINPDAILVQDNAILTLVAYLVENEKIGIVGPEIHEPSKSKHVLPRKKYPSEGRLKYTSKLKALPGNYAWILGACMMMRKTVFREIGGFDPDFFLYGEDADICLRLRLAGYQVGYCSNATITHVGSASERTATSLDKYLRKKRGFFLFCKKHYDLRDVSHIARMALITTYFGLIKLVIVGFFKRKHQLDLLHQKQRLQASKIAAREMLDQMDISPH